MNTLFGLKKDSKVKLIYSLKEEKVVRYEGIEEDNPTIEISDHMVFSMPMCITVNGIPFFPSKYEILTNGQIIYASKTVPRERIRITDDNFLNERAKVKRNTISFQDLVTNNKIDRMRTPSQNNVMGESASEHVQSLIRDGILVLENQDQISWHWCHLVAFSMLPTEKAQKSPNLVCATAACNGHMANIEAAVKKFIYEFKRPLSLEVTATKYLNTHVALKIRYRIYDKNGSGLSHIEYFDALTDVKTDIADFETIYQRLLKNFEETTHNKT